MSENEARHKLIVALAQAEAAEGIYDAMPAAAAGSQPCEERDPPIFFFGPWNTSGHHFRGPDGGSISRDVERALPWGPSGKWKIDGALIPNRNYYAEGEAWITHEHGWTALSFWDMSVDTRPASHSTYIAEGHHSFERMVELAKKYFPTRWARMKFLVAETDLPVEQRRAG